MSASLDGRYDIARPSMHSNRLNEYKIQELRGQVDAVLTSAERLMVSDEEFPVKDSKNTPKIVVVDKLVELPPEASILKDESKRVMLVTCRKANQQRIKRLQTIKTDLMVQESGEHGINLEDMLWELSRADVKQVLLEGDSSLNSRMLGQKLVDEIYVLVAPVIMGEGYANAIDDRLDERCGLNLEGIIQYGEHVVLHYKVVDSFR